MNPKKLGEKKKRKEKKVIPFNCPECSAVFSRKYDMSRHYKRKHVNANCVHQCTLCGGIFNSVFYLKKHRESHRVESGNFIILDKAFKRKCLIYRKTYNEKIETLNAAFEGDKKDMNNILKYEIEVKTNIKASVIFHAEFYKPLDATGSVNPDTYVLCLRTTTSHLCNSDEIALFLEDAIRNAEMRIDDFVERGSGNWDTFFYRILYVFFIY